MLGSSGIAIFAGSKARTDPSDPAPRGYVCPRTIATPTVDGSIDEAIWGHAPWTDEFVDIEGDRKPRPTLPTRAKMLWDDDYFYIAVALEEPHVWGNLTEHDSVIFQDNDFEVFIDPSGDGHHYAELEMNALNTTWDLLLSRSYRAGGLPYTGWEMHGLRTAVKIDGTLNNPADTDRGWSVEIAIPWTALYEVAQVACPPEDGDQWRVNFSRVQWMVDIVDGAYQKVPDRPEDNWVWSPQGAIDMHRPERWGVVQFTSETNDLPEFRPLEDWSDRLMLVTVWEEQLQFHQQRGRYATTADELELDLPQLIIEATTVWTSRCRCASP